MMGNLVNKKSPQDVTWACTQAIASRPFGTSRSNLLANVQDWLKNTLGKSPNPKCKDDVNSDKQNTKRSKRNLRVKRTGK